MSLQDIESMTKEIFESLLLEEEGTTLDFKSQQYSFSGASNIEKSELLKDILGFANAWRRESDAYILIGVKEVLGGCSEVVGIDRQQHLDDHSLQQFVNSRINQPIQFRYEAYEYGGKQVGIICINEVSRPIFLQKDFGKLKKNEVYVRRGSSTDPGRPAAPDEIVRMGLSASLEEAKLEVSFADIHRDLSLGTVQSIKGDFLSLPDSSDIPEYGNRRLTPHDPLSNLIRIQISQSSNEKFYEELANFEFHRRSYRQIRLSVKNTGSQPARNVRLEMQLDNNLKVHVIEEQEFPRAPRKKRGIIPDLYNIPPAMAHRVPGVVDITNKNQKSFIEIDFQDLQPGREIYSDTFLVAIGESGSIGVSGIVLSDNIPKPQEFTLWFDADITVSTLGIDELCSMDEPGDVY